MSVQNADPYSVILRRRKIPMALLQDCEKVSSVNLLETESFSSVFGKKSTRKRPKILGQSSDYSEIASIAAEKLSAYSSGTTPDSNVEAEAGRGGVARREDLFFKGQSKRIW